MSTAEKKATDFTLRNKKFIKDTTLIIWLKEKTKLSFFGICDENDAVDAVVRINNSQQFKSALDLQKILKGKGFFTEGEKEKWFVLKGINTNEEGDNCMGRTIQRCLTQKVMI